MMANKIATFIIFMGAYFLGACSAVKFSQSFDCEKDKSCVVQNGKPVYPGQDYVVDGGKVDILIVTDNSASMSYEQERMAIRFGQFINNLEKKSVDYRIAFTTTDISSPDNGARGINQNGALQDGKLITMSSGKKFLSRDDGNLSQKIEIFNQAVKRKETQDCETFIRNWIAGGRSLSESSYDTEYSQNCPSGDERGIYAANIVVKNNPDSFLRDEADLQIIFLSDEDERSQLYASLGSYALTDLDLGRQLPQNIRTQYPSKNFGIHPIIVADEYCLPLQSQQLLNVVKGSYGFEYNNARKAAQSLINNERKVKGLAPVTMVLGDVCSDDYTQQLQNIFDQVTGPIVDNFAIKCSTPEGLTVTVSTSDPSVSHEIVGKVIKFNKKLPVGTKVSISAYSCND